VKFTSLTANLHVSVANDLNLRYKRDEMVELSQLLRSYERGRRDD
jgi:hypothetical protein